MTIQDKKELVRLLHEYMNQIIIDDRLNTKENYKSAGLKAQYEHARIIATKLSIEVGKSIRAYWEL